MFPAIVIIMGERVDAPAGLPLGKNVLFIKSSAYVNPSPLFLQYLKGRFRKQLSFC